MKTGIGWKLKSFVTVVVIGTATSAFAETVQQALDRFYEGWTASNLHSAAYVEGDVIVTHPASLTTAATLTWIGAITGAYPVLHLKLAAHSGDDWVLNMRINGQKFCTSATINSADGKDYEFPLAAWANQGDVKIELDNASGGTAPWSGEFGHWLVIEIKEDESAYKNNNCKTVQDALDVKAPGWSAWSIYPGSVSIGSDGESVVTHPYDEGVPCFLSRTMEITGENPIFVLKVAAHDANADWLFGAQIDGETVIPRQQIYGAEPVEFRIPLARWKGRESVEIRLFNWPGGTRGAWMREFAHWHQIDIVEGEPTGEPALFYSYLQGRGGQFINTGYFANQTSVFDLKLYEPGTGYVMPSAVVFGGGAYDDFGTVLFSDRTDGAFTGTFGLAKTCYHGAAFPCETWVDVNVDIPNQLASWTSAGQDVPATISASGNALNSRYPVFVFDGSNGASGMVSNEMTAAGENSMMRLHSFCIREGEVVKMNLIPYRRTDGLKGLLDVQTGTFYPNVGFGEFHVGGLGYVTDGTRLIAHEGKMEPFDLEAGYTVVEKVSTGELNVNHLAALPPLALTEGTVSFADATACVCRVYGTFSVAAGTTLVFGLHADGCDTVYADTMDLGEANAGNPIRIRLAMDKDVDYGQTFTLIASNLSSESLACFALEGETSFMLSVEDGALVLHYNDPTVPALSVWTGASGDGDLSNAANWATTNCLGRELLAVPTVDTFVRIPDGCVFNCTNGAPFAYRVLKLPSFIGGDCDWRGLDLQDDTTIYLNGHKLYLSNLTSTSTIANTVADDGASSAGLDVPMGELHIDVPEGKTVTNSIVSLRGQIMLVKEGAGTFVAALNGQTYAGGTVIREGVCKADVQDGCFTPFGVQGSTLTVEKGAQYLDDTYVPWATRFLVLRIAGTGPDGTGAIRTLHPSTGGLNNAFLGWCAGLELTDDAEIGRDAYAFSLVADEYREVPVVLNGHTLKFTSDTWTFAPNCPFLLASSLRGMAGDKGTIVIGDNVQLFPYLGTDSNLPDVTLVIAEAAVYSSETYDGLHYDGVHNVTVSNLVNRSNSTASQTVGLTTVLGCYTPVSTTSAPRVQLGDAEHLSPTLDLSERTTPLDVSLGGGLTFAPGAKVNVDFGVRRVKNRTQVLKWKTIPADVTFVSRTGGGFLRQADGLYFQKGFCIFMR